MAIILGIDPGSQITGYGVVSTQGKDVLYVTSGCIRVQNLTLSEKLKQIFTGIQEVVCTHQIEESAIEQVFVHLNPDSALKLGQARGAAIAAASLHLPTVHEYSAKQIKKTVTGYGAASKTQIQQMVLHLLKLSGSLQSDAADGLAVALCHAQIRQSPMLKTGSRLRRRRMA